ncbi:MAG: restriction endonuclease subunit R, partial [Chloroflexota bacterium]|nr:restriction endonuclease subunit R [Chloroflexota bacterium]
GDKNLTIPELNYEWIEILLTFYLYNDSDNFGRYKVHQEQLIGKLKRNGIIERRSINFRHHRTINKLLSTSISKLNSIDRIIDFEHKQLKRDLRAVILTDYIRKEFLVNQAENNLELNKIGVLPIFEKLRRTNDQNIKIGVLTGSIIIIPSSALDTFEEISANNGVDDFNTSSLPFDNQYLIVNATESMKHAIVHIVTQVFKQGEIEVLVGTKALLGEGWDAPFINSLVLASFVGSYVSSNQMRGRAIRTQKNRKDKTSNIWHLACIDMTAPDGGDDIQLLKRRFKSFVGISFTQEPYIGNGFDRLKLPEQLDSNHKIDRANEMMIKHAGNREQLTKRWEEALTSGQRLVEEIKTPFAGEKNYKETTSLYYRRTIGYLLAMLGSGLAAFSGNALESLLRSSENINTLEDLYRALLVIGGIGIFIFGGLAFKTFRLYIKHRDISKDIHQIAEALLVSLIKAGFIHTDYSRLAISTKVDDYGAVYCHLKGGTIYEKSTFTESLHEIISAVDNPRYLIIRKNLLLKLFSQQDYHSVPERLGKNRTLAEYFKKQWSRFVGSCELVYTRTVQGRKLLLQSRLHSLASEFEEKAERIRIWK